MSVYLTSADMTVIRLVAGGLTNSDIGHQLGITADQAKVRVDTALRHAQARNRAHLVAVACQQGLLFGDSPLRAAVRDLLRKVDEHRHRAYGHIRLGAIEPVRAAFHDVLTPMPGTTAAALDALIVEPVELDCDGDPIGGDAA